MQQKNSIYDLAEQNPNKNFRRGAGGGGARGLGGHKGRFTLLQHIQYLPPYRIKFSSNQQPTELNFVKHQQPM